MSGAYNMVEYNQMMHRKETVSIRETINQTEKAPPTSGGAFLHGKIQSITRTLVTEAIALISSTGTAASVSAII